jgi:hypothetical protein
MKSIKPGIQWIKLHPNLTELCIKMTERQIKRAEPNIKLIKLLPKRLKRCVINKVFIIEIPPAGNNRRNL